MTFAAPWFAWGAVAVALTAVALHLLAWRRPPESPLPTARFAPERPVRMVSRTIRLSDLGLLALRVLLVLLVGFGLAGPAFTARRVGTARVVVLDRSRGAAAGTSIDAAARGELRTGDALVVFDSMAREVKGFTPDSIVTRTSSVVRGSISAGLVAAMRAARRLQRDHDSVEIVLVSPVGDDELDAATASIRRMWPGTVRTVRAGSAPNDTSAVARPAIRALAGDPVAAALTLAGGILGGASVRVARDRMTSADSAWAREGRTMVDWPSSVAPSGWERRRSLDTAFAVTAMAGGSGPRPATVVAPFVRTVLPSPGRISARWSDGEPAVTESTLGAGCIRSVAVGVPAIGDLALTSAFGRFARRMAERCGNDPTWTPISDSVLVAVLPATVPPPERRASIGVGYPGSKLAVWLLGLALLVALAELFLRRGAADATA